MSLSLCPNSCSGILFVEGVLDKTVIFGGHAFESIKVTQYMLGYLDDKDISA